MYIIQKRRLKQPFSPTYLSSMKCKLGTDAAAVSQTPRFPALAGFSEETGRKSSRRQMCQIIASCDLYREGNERPRQTVTEGGGSFPKGDVSSEAQRLGESCSGVGQCRCKGPGAGETCLEGGEEVNALAPAGPGAVACWKGLGFRSCCSRDVTDPS